MVRSLRYDDQVVIIAGAGSPSGGLEHDRCLGGACVMTMYRRG